MVFYKLVTIPIFDQFVKREWKEHSVVGKIPMCQGQVSGLQERSEKKRN